LKTEIRQKNAPNRAVSVNRSNSASRPGNYASANKYTSATRPNLTNKSEIPNKPDAPKVDIDPEMQDMVSAYIKQKEKRRKWLAFFCALTALVCFFSFGAYTYFGERMTNNTSNLANLRGDTTYAHINMEPQVVVHRTGEIELPDILEEFKTLWNQNKRIIGWIKIDKTNIDYPVMQTVNNEYYLDRNFSQEYDKNGSIFMDYQCELYPRSDNLIIYGHHMKNGKMFGQLQKYEKESFYKDHKIIQFDTIYEKGTYEVMFAFRSKVYNEEDIVFKYYQFIDVISVEEFNSNMREMAALSYYDTGVTASYGDELLTLSTCDNATEAGRFVVVAKRIG